MGLEWNAVDFDAGTVTVRQGRVAVTATEIGDPKSWRFLFDDRDQAQEK